ncbi:MAG TPA: response regulator [Geobacteraceae bacterium]|nr:response regulator [Geobacteraceae bacterium]
MRLLVVDDKPEIRKLLSSAMELCGHKVDTASDGIDAINLRLSNQYDAVITDADMPRMDGFRLCKFMKKEFPGTRVIGMSGAWGEKAFRNAGVDICLSIPFTMVDLKKAVEDDRSFFSLKSQWRNKEG